MPAGSIPHTDNMERLASLARGPDLKEGLADKAHQAGAALTEAAQRVGGQAKEAASSLASATHERLHGYMDQQVTAGAELAAQVANAIKAAANELDRTSPALGGVVRSSSEMVQDLSRQFRDKSAEEVLAETRDFVRRKPALVFGAAAVLGFVAYRILNAGMSQGASPDHRYAGSAERHSSNVPSQGGPAGFASNNSTGRIHAG